ncbi:MAG: N-acetylmuramoyl-L-alanine amidase [Puniceicoccales bacterium]|nr:N-acetylmuramoyl-L-alanine amidase [Puniceicoccales bacterium]
MSRPKTTETASTKNKNLSKKTPTKKSSATQAPKSDSATPFLIINGITHLSMKDIAQSLQSKILLNNGKGSATMTKGGATVQFNTRQDHIVYQDVPINLINKPKLNNKEIFVSYTDYSSVLIPLLATNLIQGETPKLKTVVIDAGHGGKDSGAINQRLNISEKTLTLKTAQLLQKHLIKQQKNVIMTRETDIYKNLKDRSKDAANADVFISIHINAAQNASAHGMECYIYTPKDSLLENIKNNSSQKISPLWNIPLAYCMNSALQKETKLTNRGVKKANFAVLKELPCPGILIELGFISNDEEAAKLNNPTFQEKIVQGLINGLKKYEENLKKTRQAKNNDHGKQSTSEKMQKLQPKSSGSTMLHRKHPLLESHFEAKRLILEKTHHIKSVSAISQEKPPITIKKK